MIDAGTVLIGSRLAFYVGALFLWGASGVCLLIPPHLRALLWGELLRLCVAATALSVAATLVALPVQSATIVGGWGRMLDPAVLQTVVFQTRVGAAWGVQCITILLLASTVIWAKATTKAPLDHRASGPGLIAVASALVLMAPTLSGHAALHTGWLRWLHAGNDWLHLLAAGFWFGALYPVTRLLGHLHTPTRARDALIGLMRFSQVGHLAVATVILTGVINVWLIVGEWPGLFDTTYQRWLWLKIGIVASMIAVALYNRYRLVPRQRTMCSDIARRRLRRLTLTEIGLALGAMASVALFGLLDPH